MDLIVDRLAQYNGGQKVTYNGHLWTAKWWSYASTPGGSVGDWQDDGACASFNVVAPTVRSAAVVALSREPAPAPSA